MQAEPAAASRPVEKRVTPPPKPGLPFRTENAPVSPAAGGPRVFVPNAGAKNGGKPPGSFAPPAAATPLAPADGPLRDSAVAAASPVPALPTPREDPAVTLLSVGLSEDEKQSVKEALGKFPSLYDSKTLMSMLFRAHAEDWHQRSEERLKSAAWPEHLAEQCAEEIKAYLRPGFLSRNGEFSLLQDETFANYHVRRAVMREFNELVYRSDQRNIVRHPEAVGVETPFGKTLQAKAGLSAPAPTRFLPVFGLARAVDGSLSQGSEVIFEGRRLPAAILRIRPWQCDDLPIGRFPADQFLKKRWKPFFRKPSSNLRSLLHNSPSSSNTSAM